MPPRQRRSGRQKPLAPRRLRPGRICSRWVAGKYGIGAGVDQAGEKQRAVIAVDEGNRNEGTEDRSIDSGGLSVLPIGIEPGKRPVSQGRRRSARPQAGRDHARRRGGGPWPSRTRRGGLY